MTKQIENIKKMETVLNSMEEKLDNLETALDDFENYLSEFQKLEKYYGSQAWNDDLESYDAGKFPTDLACGVLSEDAIYNLIIRHREFWIRIAKLGIKMVE